MLPATDESAHQLRRLEVLADPELAELETSELVHALLTRIEEILAVDTVAVLVLDRGGSQLVARAARGLEDEVRQGFRLPIGRGFAGRVASTRAPVIVDDVGPGTVVNPILWRQGIRSMLGVPLVAGGQLVGVLHVGTLQPRRFSEDDTAVLQVAADRIATTVSSEQTAAERTAARTLQQSLLPTQLPEVDGLEFASRFATAEDFGVGGDWYDAFRLPDDQVGVVIGDVAGHGLSAAVVMGRVRSALRAYAIESATPGQALDRLRRKFAHFEPGKMATVLYLTIAADLESFTIASTGHLPPVIAVPGREPIMLNCSSGPPIGAPAAADHVNVVCELSPGTTVGCYTDGLVERRDVSIDDRLQQLRAAFYAGDVEDVCGTVAAELIGPEVVQDDTALLVFRRMPRS